MCKSLMNNVHLKTKISKSFELSNDLTAKIEIKFR